MNVPQDLKYTASHEWVRREADGSLVVGITDHAQEQLGDMVFVETPKPGRKVAPGEAVGVVESVKAASDFYAPVAGEVLAGNEEVAGSPEKVNSDAYGCWLFRMKPDNVADLDKLLDAAAYEKLAAD